MEHGGRMRSACVVLAAAVAGLMFAPVFGVPALVPAVGVPAAVVAVVAALVSGRAGAAPWRPLLLAVAGLLAVVETTLSATTMVGLPTGETLNALALGVTDSWQLALQSTWPARADPDLLLFVPLLVVAAGVLGIELLERSGSPVVALLPSLAVVVLAQLFVAALGWAAALAALGYATAAGTLLAVTRPNPVPGERAARTLAAMLLAPAVAVACAVLAAVLVASPPPAYTLKDDQMVSVSDLRVTSPLGEIAGRLAHPEVTVFRGRGDLA
jgi:hypothetical protein